MSYILDALKKVEREKTRKATAGGMTSISGDLFQERIKRPSPNGARKTVVVIVLVSLATFAATWFLLKDDKKKAAVASPSTVATAVIVPAPVPNPPAPAPVPAPSPQQIPAPPASAAKATPPTVVPQPVAAVSDDMDRATGTEKKSAKNPPPRPQKTSVQTIPAPTDIKLSGIAWQEERAARRVVINGFLLQEGATVSGVKILEIHQDRVRFWSPAGIFDLRMDAAIPLGMPK
jgi:hypothetical protein